MTGPLTLMGIWFVQVETLNLCLSRYRDRRTLSNSLFVVTHLINPLLTTHPVVVTDDVFFCDIFLDFLYLLFPFSFIHPPCIRLVLIST